MKTLNLNGNPEVTETELLSVVCDILESNHHESNFSISDDSICEFELTTEETIYWKIMNINYFDNGTIKSVDLDC